MNLISCCKSLPFRLKTVSLTKFVFQKFSLPIVKSDDGLSYLEDPDYVTYYIVSDFDSSIFKALNENHAKYAI